VLVIDNYCENIKVLRHQMAPLGGKECRILGAGIDGKKPKAVAVFASLEQVLILLCVCSHTAMYVSSYCCMCVRILLYVCPHTATYVFSYCYI
jgi:hypothetical protein